MAKPREVFRWARRSGKRAAITLIGATLLVGGLLLIWLPGPFTIPLVIAGLAVLATEYVWARRALDETKRRARGARDKIRRRPKAS